MQEARLKEIETMTLAGLSDDAILELLAERKHLENVVREYQKQDALEAESKQRQASLVKKEKSIEAEIAHLNEEISPDKDDDELLELVKERKVLEQELLSIEQELGQPLPGQGVEKPAAPEIEEAVEAPKQAAASIKKEEAVEPKTEIQPEQEVAVTQASEPIFKEAGFGEVEIRLDGLQESGEFEKYVHQLEASRDSLGAFLQSLPRAARANRSFMLRVAATDPAYAMHYAVDGLRKDEEFHVQIASMKNSRGSGNALAEMDPEMRTGKVVLAGTRQDFRNVRFVQEDMPEHDQILLAAKKGALEKTKEFKEAVDVRLLIPKILQQDEAFMAEIQKMQQKNQA